MKLRRLVFSNIRGLDEGLKYFRPQIRFHALIYPYSLVPGSRIVRLSKYEETVLFIYLLFMNPFMGEIYTYYLH